MQNFTIRPNEDYNVKFNKYRLNKNYKVKFQAI